MVSYLTEKAYRDELLRRVPLFGGVLLRKFGSWTAFGQPWIPTNGNLSLFSELGSKVGQRSIFLEKDSRENSTIRYSYCRDIRFVLLLCNMMGSSLWSTSLPLPFFAIARLILFALLTSGYVIGVFQDTFYM